jgi:hypothetical protein
VLNFSLTVGLAGGSSISTSLPVEVGIRSDDVIIVGWIDRNNVPDTQSFTGIPPDISTGLQPDGNVQNASACAAIIFGLSENCTNPTGHELSPSERAYILYWMFRFSSNPNPSDVIPGGQFLDAAGIASDEVKVANFLAQGSNYKLFNRFQVRWRIGSDPTKFLITPIATRPKTAAVGATVDPCHSPLPPPQPQSGPANQSSIATSSQISMVNDGSPDEIAVRAFNTLSGRNVASPVFWENIGSRITFAPTGAFSGLQVMQPYPSYNIYVNGTYTGTRAQASDPFQQFVVNPYPFGTVSCTRACGITPGGRCGDAVSPAEVTARTPPFVVQQ